MHLRFSDYPHLYSGNYFQPNFPQPVPASWPQRIIFYLGLVTTTSLFPITLPLVFVLMRRVPR